MNCFEAGNPPQSRWTPSAHGALAGMMMLLLTTFPVLAEVPDVLEANDPSRQAPAWVSAKAATTEAGLNPDFFLPHEAASIERAIAPEPERAPDREPEQESLDPRCSRWITTSVDWETQRPNKALPQLVRNAKAAYAGTVVDVEQGFYFGQAGSLLEVRVERQVKYSGTAPPATVLVFYPFAKIRVGDRVVCARGERAEDAPKLGNRILVFGYRSSGDDKTEVIYPDDEEIIFERSDGTLSLSRRLEGLPPDAGFDEVVEAAEDMRRKGV